MNFKNKVVVITGASSGIGEATAIEFAKRGADTVLVARRKEKLLEVEKKLSSFSGSSFVCQCDVIHLCWFIFLYSFFFWNGSFIHACYGAFSRCCWRSS